MFDQPFGGGDWDYPGRADAFGGLGIALDDEIIRRQRAAEELQRFRGRGTFAAGPPTDPYGQQPEPLLALSGPSQQTRATPISPLMQTQPQRNQTPVDVVSNLIGDAADSLNFNFTPTLRGSPLAPLADVDRSKIPFTLQGSPFAGMTPPPASRTADPLQGAAASLPTATVVPSRASSAEIAPSPRDRQYEQAPSPRSLQMPAMPELASAPRDAAPLEQAPMPSAPGRHAAIADWTRQMANQPPLEAGQYQAAPVHPDDRHRLTPLEQRLQDMTGVAYGQMPMHFDPRLRMQTLLQMDTLGLAGSENDLRRELLGMQGNQEMQRLMAQIAGQRELAGIEGQNRLDVEGMRSRPDMNTMRNDAIVKLLVQSLAIDPSGDSFRQVVNNFGPAWQGLMAGMNPQMGGPTVPGGPLAAQPDRDAATQTLNAMRALISKQSQNEAGQTVHTLNEAALQPMMGRVAQIYGQANLNPAAREEFMRMFNMRERGGLGDPGLLREAAAREAAKLYLQANPAPAGGYPESLSVPDPNDPTRTLFTLGRQPRDPFSRFGLDYLDMLRRNPWAVLNPVAGASAIAGSSDAIPYELLTIPGRGTTDFNRSDVVPFAGVGQDAARQKAKRDLEAILQFNAAIAQRQLQPQR